MTTMTDLVYYDGAATPVQHTFKAITSSKSNSGKYDALWREATLSVPEAAQGRVEMASETFTKSGVRRVEVKVVLPVQETISGANSSGYTAAPKVAHELTGSCVFLFSPRATIAEKRTLRQLLMNVVWNTAASNVAVVTGHAPEAVDMSILPT